MAIAAGSLCVFMPLRYAASILAMLQLILSTILAIALWTEVSKWSVDVGVRITGTSAAAATYYTILAFSALIGYASARGSLITCLTFIQLLRHIRAS